MKKMISLLFIVLIENMCFGQTYFINPLSNNITSNSRSYNNRYYPIDPKTGLQKSPNGYNYYPSFNIPPLQKSGYTLQNTQPYVGQYYFNAEYWLFKW